MSTKLLPALDILDGRAVRLTGGAFDRVTDYGDNLRDILAAYAAAGCDMAHLVDLSGARDPAGRQLELLRSVCTDKALKIQVGGGIRSTADVDALFAIGADRIVIGSWAVKSPADVAALIAQHGVARFVLAMDCNVNAAGVPEIAIHGWQASSGLSMDDVLAHYKDFTGLHILCTDIARDGMLTGANVELYQRMMERFPQFNWIASGGVSQLDDLHAIAAANIPAVVVGKALYEGRFTVAQALVACNGNAPR